MEPSIIRPFESSLSHSINGTEVVFLKEKAIYLPKQNALILSDVHLGKALHFRQNGLPVSDSPELETLNRLSALHQRYPQAIFWVVGDLFHRGSLAHLGLFSEWLAANPAVKMNLVAGNHDKGCRNFCERTGIGFYEGSYPVEGFTLNHELLDNVDSFTISGHIHPVWFMKGKIGSISLPCFWLKKNSLVLPAFGGFTGGWKVPPQEADAVVLASPNGVKLLELSGFN